MRLGVNPTPSFVPGCPHPVRLIDHPLSAYNHTDLPLYNAGQQNPLILYVKLQYHKKPNAIAHAHIAHMLNPTEDTFSVCCSIVFQIVRVSELTHAKSVVLELVRS